MAEEIPAPFAGQREAVQDDWIDHNGHLNMGYYVVAFDHATDAWLDFVGLDRRFKAAHGVTTFTLESHVTYRREVGAGVELAFTTQLLAFDAKRIHYFHRMLHAQEGYLVATNELLSLHVSLQTRRSAPLAPAVLARLAAIREAHARLPIPPEVGRVMGLAARATT